MSDMFMHEGAAYTLAFEHPTFLRVYRSDDLEDGSAPVMWAVDRSIRLSEDRPLYQPARELIGDAELLGSETVDDDAMMGGAAVRSIYVASPKEPHVR